MNVDCGPMGTVHEYVPFYFSPRVPMLLKILNSKNIDQRYIIYLAVKTDVIEREDVVFTSASANTNIPPTFYCEPKELANLRWSLIDSNDWSFSDGDRHAKMAEVLIHEKVEFSEIDFIVVWKNKTWTKVNNILGETIHKIEIKNDGYKLSYGGRSNYRNHYFTKFWFDKTQSLVTGPELLYSRYKKTVRSIKEKHQSGIPSPKFKNISDTIQAISQDLAVIPEIATIKDLETANDQHWQTVGDHTKRVVEKLDELEEYQAFSNPQKKVLKLAAYLHDIGKAKSQKINGKQNTYTDHPASAIPMLKRILSEDIKVLFNIQIRRIVMLVAYHDLIGDVIDNDRNRDKEQILKVIRTMDDFDMLVAISKADVSSLISGNQWHDLTSGATGWLRNINANVPELREWIEHKLKEKND